MSEPLPLSLPSLPSSLPSSSSSSSIKHIVISSGGPAGHMMYSVLRTLNIKGVWDIKDIKSIYGSSIGSYIAIILALRYEWEVMDDYLIKRPWEKIFVTSSSASAASAAASSIDVNDHLHLSGSSLADAKNKLGHIFQLYNTHGLYGLKEFTEMIRPALQGKDMTTKITFQEFYDRTGIEVHFTVTEMNKCQAIDFSYKTHPNQSLVEACYMSCCYPFGFAPIYRDGCCYLDGGIVNNYPLHDCIRDQKCGLGEILGVKVLWEKKPTNLTEKSSLLQFINTFFNQINSNLHENRATKAIPNEVVCVSKVFSIRDWMNWMKDENYRRELVLRGETFANVFLSYRRNFKDSEAEAAPTLTPTPTLQPSVSITSLTDLAQEMATADVAAEAADVTAEAAEATEPTTMM
jgi:predicted acylesterase/phospholipase RssA